MQVIRDLEYLRGGNPRHRLDIYRPIDQSKSPLPIVLYMHGGAFHLLSKNTHWLMGLAFARAGYLAVNMVVGNVVEPRVMGARLGLSTLVVFLSLVFWGWLWGALGMLLSVPLTMVIKILAQNSAQFRWLAVLLDSEAHDATPTSGQGEQTPA